MNLAHVHLLLNHFPTIGFALGLGLFIAAIVRKSDDLKRASLVIFFGIAVLAIPTYFSGNAAEDVIKDTPGVSIPLIQEHESAALGAFVVMEITGFIAWLALWQFRKSSRLESWNITAILVLALLTFGLMTNAANIGGEIRHTEIASQPRIEGTATEEPVGAARGIGAWVTAHTWVWPACESLHFVGLCLLFTVVLLVDLRMLGMGKSLPFTALHQLLPFGFLGFSINFVTGMLFFLATPEQYINNVAFHWKILFVVLGGINVLYFMFFDEAWEVGPGDDAPLSAKVVAASGIFVWISVLYFGHMLPFIGNAF